jgi:molybdopterin-containing oxidoreductase family membrane subunit
MLLFNVIVPQLFWLRRMRRNMVVIVVVSILINIGMWFERVGIVLNTLSHDYLPSMWRVFMPTIWDWFLLAGSLGFFAFLYLILSRLVPMVSMHEVRGLVAAESGS